MGATDAAAGDEEDPAGDVVDLREIDGDADPFSPERILAWLQRASGGLHERTMKAAAAELLESTFIDETPSDRVDQAGS